MGDERERGPNPTELARDEKMSVGWVRYDNILLALLSAVWWRNDIYAAVVAVSLGLVLAKSIAGAVDCSRACALSYSLTHRHKQFAVQFVFALVRHRLHGTHKHTRKRQRHFNQDDPHSRVLFFVCYVFAMMPAAAAACALPCSKALGENATHSLCFVLIQLIVAGRKEIGLLFQVLAQCTSAMCAIRVRSRITQPTITSAIYAAMLPCICAIHICILMLLRCMHNTWLSLSRSSSLLNKHTN